jgi:hypothetical protein
MNTVTQAPTELLSSVLNEIGLPAGRTRYHALVHSTIQKLWNHVPSAAYHSLVAAELGRAAGLALMKSERDIAMPFVQVPGPNVVGVAFALHDIAKQYVAADVLDKRGKFTQKEHALMRQHPGQGFYDLRRNGLNISVPNDKLILYLALAHHICPMVLDPRLSESADATAQFDPFFDNYHIMLPQGRQFNVASYPSTIFQHSCGQYEISLFNTVLQTPESVVISEASMNWGGQFGRLVDGVTAVSEGRSYIPQRSLTEIFELYHDEIEAGLYGQDRQTMGNVLEAMLDQVALSRVIPLREEILFTGQAREAGASLMVAA